MVYEYSQRTEKGGIYDITKWVRDAVERSEVFEGICVVFTPHCTTGLCVTQKVDTLVAEDVMDAMERQYPEAEYKHTAGNGAAHLKGVALGASVTLIVQDGRPLLGPWQGVFFADFDGPRDRHFCVKVIKG